MYNQEFCQSINLPEKCCLCPRFCGVNRMVENGFCLNDINDNSTVENISQKENYISKERINKAKVARIALHFWEEPCVSGHISWDEKEIKEDPDCFDFHTHHNRLDQKMNTEISSGSGAVFFSGCNLKCVYCQNYKISRGDLGVFLSDEQLSEQFLKLQMKGALNINLITPTHFSPIIISALKKAKIKGLNLPIIYNTSGYENIEIINELSEVIDVFMPDLKYYSSKISKKYSDCEDYFAVTSKVILKMFKTKGEFVLSDDGIIQKGVIIRHLMLPSQLFDSKKIVDFVAENFDNKVIFSLMSQYTPCENVKKKGLFPELEKPLKKSHYEAICKYTVEKGIENCYIQQNESANESFIPNFDCKIL